jgi:hypothetical protein
MGVHGIAHTRFAISPLAELAGLLELSARPERARAHQRPWLRATCEVLDGDAVPLLRALTGPGRYLPDLLVPEPSTDGLDVTAQLRLVRATPARRVRAEMTAIVRGRPAAGLAPQQLPAPVAAALAVGEAHLAQRLADELAVLWPATLGPVWPSIRAFLAADVDRQAGVLARSGAAALLSQLHPQIGWRDGAIYIESPYEAAVDCDETLVLMPTAVRAQPNALIDPCYSERRPPIVCYPVVVAVEPAPAGRTAPLGATLGATRAALLADLHVPRTTTELAGRHHLTLSAVSYHLGILHRSGLAQRSRSGARVLYRRTPHADVLLSAPSGA